MNISPALIDDLHELTAPLDVDVAELPSLIQLLEDAAALAVPTLLGWKVSFSLQDQPLTLVSIRPRVDLSDIGASLQIPLDSALGLDLVGHLTLYAAEPHAFTILAGDLAAALHLPVCQFRCDTDLEPDLVSGIGGLREASTFNQAIGVLIDRGDTAADAHAKVTHRSPVTHLDAYRLRK